MNVTTNKTGDLSAVITVNIQPGDYQEKVENKLKDYRKRANIPGFRPGKVPASLVKKQYGKQIMIEEINHILQHAIYDHIQKEKLDILGNPMPVPNDSIDWDKEDDFKFDFEVGLSPEFEVEINEKIKVPYNKIVADKEMVDRYVTDYAKRFGSMKQPETVTENSIVKAIFSELDDKGAKLEEGLRHEGSFSMESVEDKKLRKELLGKKIGDTLNAEVNTMFKEGFNVANLLGTDTTVLENTSGKFELDIIEISEVVPAELNQELFDKVFGEGAVSSEEEFRAKVKEDAEKMFVGESDRKFNEDVKEVVLKKLKFELPDEFLKKWMQTSQQEPVSEEEIEKQYPEMKDSLKWQLVENKVARQNNIEVSQEELVAYTKELVARQMMQYGQQPEEAELDNIAQRVLENKDEAQRITDQLFTEKLMQFYKENVKLETKEMSFDEFIKQMSA